MSTRREFLGSTGAAIGALVIGVALPVRGRAAQAAASAGSGPALLNAYVRIAPDGTVTFIVPKSEMGQGIYTGYAQVLAEELEVDLARVRVECAPVAPEYNVPFAPFQFTGGSMSIASQFDQLRMLGATARTMLVSAAAAELGVPASELRAADGAVVHAASGRSLGYGALAARAAALPAPKDVALKPRKDWRLIGRSLARVDSREKSTGAGIFGLDVRVPNLHYALVARAPTFGATVRSYDATAALQLPGVVKVVQVPTGVAVVATNTWAARRGRDALVVDWADGAGAAFSSEATRAQYAALAREPGTAAREVGKVALYAPGQKAGRGTKQLAADYETPYLSHASMEPLNCAVVPGTDGWDVYTGTQMQTLDRDVAARVAGIEPAKLRMHTTLLGGGFGRRANGHSDFVAEATHVAKAAGLPVMTVWTREDDMHGGYYRPQAHNRLTAALGADGKPLAWTHVQVVQPIMRGTVFENFGRDPKSGLEETLFDGALIPYAIPNQRIAAHEANGPVPVLWWRSVGNTNTAFAIESFIDECAHAAKQDPVAYRLALLAEQPRHRAVLQLVAAKSGWGGKLPKGRARGVAVHASFGSVVAQVAEVSLVDGKPRVHRVVAAIDCGTAVNPALIAHQIESAVIYGLSAALYGEITLDQGRVQQSNFDDYPSVRLAEAPVVETHIVPSTEPPTGVGEPGTPPITAAVANALFALSGVRARRLPLSHGKFVTHG